MTCEELREDYDPFALGLDSAPESSEIRDHLRRDCPNCVPGVQRSLSLVTQMGGLVKVVDPPARLRNRILAAVNPALLETPKRSSFGWSILWGAASVVLLAVVVLLGYQTQRLSTARRIEMVRLEEALRIMSAPDSREVRFGTTTKEPPRGRVIVNPHRGVVLIAGHLPQLPEGKTFEMWLIPHGAKPIPSGTFRAQPDGTALALQPGTIPPDLGTVAVTVEDEGGAPAPTTTPIIAAETK